jgi:hypothetical protein
MLVLHFLIRHRGPQVSVETHPGATQLAPHYDSHGKAIISPVPSPGGIVEMVV